MRGAGRSSFNAGSNFPESPLHLPDREARSQCNLLADLEAQHRGLTGLLDDFMADQLVLVDPLSRRRHRSRTSPSSIAHMGYTACPSPSRKVSCKLNVRVP